MSCTITWPDGMYTYGLDAWHKLQLGWVEPRIRLLSTGGIETIAAAQSIAATDAPIILYDPAHGVQEFFLLEYRTSTSPWGAGYEDDLPSNGLGIWHVVHDGDKNLIQWIGLGQTVWLKSPPSLQRSETNCLWASGATTPALSWWDGYTTTPIPTSVVVRPFNPGDASITFEWRTVSDTWVDFPYAGAELGTFEQPFNTLNEGIGAASHGGRLKIKAGATAESASVSKALTLEAIGGTVTIGR